MSHIEPMTQRDLAEIACNLGVALDADAHKVLMHSLATRDGQWCVFLADREKQAARVPGGVWPVVPEDVMQHIQVYGEAKAHNRYSELRLSDLIYALRRWAAMLAAPTTEPSKAEQADAPSDPLWPVDGLYPDMQPPATSRDRWMYDQGRLAERRIAATQPPASNAGERTEQLVRPLPETMTRDEMLKYYSSYANLCAHEALEYQKRIRDLEAALATKPQAGQKPVAWMTPNPYKPELLMVTIEKPNVNGVDWPGARPLVYGDVTSQAGDVAQDSGEPPLLGRWHHGEGYLVSGSIRIARWDCDTNPPDEFRDEVLDWVSNTLNAAIRAARTRGEGSGT